MIREGICFSRGLMEKKYQILASGLPAGPGGACGQIVLDADTAEILNNKGYPVILVRNETSPEDIHGMHASEGILSPIVITALHFANLAPKL